MKTPIRDHRMGVLNMKGMGLRGAQSFPDPAEFWACHVDWKQPKVTIFRGIRGKCPTLRNLSCGYDPVFWNGTCINIPFLLGFKHSKRLESSKVQRAARSWLCLKSLHQQPRWPRQTSRPPYWQAFWLGCSIKPSMDKHFVHHWWCTVHLWLMTQWLQHP